MKSLGILNVIEILFGVYLIVGVTLFVFGAHRKIPELRSATRGFRFIIFPSLIALWPWVLRPRDPKSEEVVNQKFQKLIKLQAPAFIALATAGLIVAGIAVSVRRSVVDPVPPQILNLSK